MFPFIDGISGPLQNDVNDPSVVGVAIVSIPPDFEKAKMAKLSTEEFLASDIHQK